MTKTNDGRPNVIQSLDSRTKLLGLVALVLEATLLGSMALLPEQHRIFAIVISAIVLMIMIVGMIAIELKNSEQSQTTNNSDKDLPAEMRGNVIEFDRKAWGASGDDAALYRTASSLKFAGKYNEAITFYNKTLAINSSHWKAKYNIGSCFIYLKNNKKAEKEFNSLIRQLKDLDWKSDNSLARLIRGAYMQLNAICDEEKRFGDGEKYLLQSLEIVPDDALAYANLAISTKKAGNHLEAAKWYQVLLEHPEKVDVLVQVSDSDKKELDSLLVISGKGEHDEQK